MNRTGWMRAIAALLVALGLSQPSLAQGLRARVSRPSEAGPSARIGRIGGTYTRSSSPLEGLGGLGGGSGDAGLAGIQRRVDQLTPTFVRAPLALQPTQTGYVPAALLPSGLDRVGQLSGGVLMQVSGFREAISFYAPVAGGPPQILPRSGTPYFAPPPADSPYHDFFGLEQTSPDEARNEPPLTTAALLKRENDTILRQREREGMQLFREATAKNAEGREEKLAQAMALFTTVSKLDASAYLPLLLIVHAALEKEQIFTATRTLLVAVRRHPAVFTERPDVSAYYGDPSQLDRVMRRIVLTDYGSESPASFALQAYCAWVLADVARVRTSLARMRQANQGRDIDEDIVLFGHAMDAALR